MKRFLITLAAALVVSLGFGSIAVAHGGDGSTVEMSEQDRAQLESNLEAKREQMRELAEEMSELSLQLADGPIRNIIRSVRIDTDRAMLGVSIESRTGDEGVYVHGVTPGGPADDAGLESGDVIVAIGGVDLQSAEDGGAQKLMEVMGDVEAGDAVDVTVLRDGQRLTRSVTTEAMGDNPTAFAFSTSPDMDFNFSFDGDMANLDIDELVEMGTDMGVDMGLDMGKNFAFVWHSGPWSDMELVELTPELGQYFGVDEGLLVVRAPKDTSLGVVDGDVIVELNGEAVSTPREFTRSLRRSEAGDVIALEVVRQRGAMRLEAQVPESDGRASIGHDDEHGDGRVIIKRRYVDKD